MVQKKMNQETQISDPILKSKWIAIALIIILGLRITSYFTLFPSSVATTQVVKVALRLMLTLISFLWLYKLKIKYNQYEVRYQNVLPFGLYLAYLTLGVLSLFWTSDVRFSMLQLFMIIEAMVFAWYYFQVLVFYNKISNNHVPFSYAFGYATFWICLAFMIGLYFDPDTYYRQTHGGEVSRLGGYIINPNELGMLAVLGAVMVYIEGLRRKIDTMQVLIWIACVAVLLLTQSRSSLGAFLMATGFTVLLSGNVKLIVSSIIGGILVMPILIREIVVKQGDMEEVMSMTGRLPFWTDLIHDGFIHRPLLGYGFMRIAKHEKFDSIHAYAASMTHNTFIQVLINLGLVGAFIVLFQVITLSITISRHDDNYYRRLAAYMLIPLVINSLTEFGIFGESNYGVQFYQLLILFFVVTVEQKKAVPTIKDFKIQVK